MIYVLSMDREVVRSALSEVHNIDGNEYLEKIIQIPFELPELSKSKVYNVFLLKLNQIIEQLPDEVVWDENYWNNVFRMCVAPYLCTLRDVNRVLNVFQFKYGALYHETSLEDMVAITTLEVLEPELYKWIGNNKDAVCGGVMHGISLTGEKKQGYRQLYSDEFKHLGIDSDRAMTCIATIFPVFAKDVGITTYSYQPPSVLRKNMRAAEEVRFELYFMFELDEVPVPRSSVNACIYRFGKNRLSAAIEKINEQGNSVYLFEEMTSMVDSIPYERLTLIVRTLLSFQGNFTGVSLRGFFSKTANDIAEQLVFNMMNRLKTEEEKFDSLQPSMKNIGAKGLGLIATIINRIELSYGRLAGERGNLDDQIVSLEHLEKLEKLYVSKLREINSIDSFIENDQFELIFYLWKCLDRKGVEAYLNRIIKDEINTLRFICALARKWTGTGVSGWYFDLDNYSEYISDEEIYSLIMNYGKGNWNVFTDNEQIKLACFALMYSNRDKLHVNEQMAKKLLDERKDEMDN